MCNLQKKTNYRETKEFKALRRYMLRSLKLRGMDGKAYRDQVEKYLDLWCIFQMAKADVDENGVFLFDERGRRTKNDSANLANQVSRQMLSIFTALGFKAEEGGNAYDDDDL